MPVRRLDWTFELRIFGENHRQFPLVANRLREMARVLESIAVQVPPDELLKEFPTGGCQGAPFGEDYPGGLEQGWRCVWTVAVPR